MAKVKRYIFPPVWLAFGIVAQFVCNEYAPLVRFTSGEWQAVGAVVLLAGLALLVLAGGLFKQAETDLIPFRNVTALVTTGVYRFTRNPMYLGMALVLLGCALTVGAASALLVPPVFMAIIHFRFILPEEQMLRELCPEEFPAYCSRVRRWL
ncbi:MAG: isoprenylcysteine carboxylmethyltransferase family protein [Halioglobus sp.]|nr:isoprenylcysteine carboxylmethyltransferase family protein [Halioglobus sp.]